MATPGGNAPPPKPGGGPGGGGGGKKPSKNVEKYFGSEVDLKRHSIKDASSLAKTSALFEKKASRDVTHPDSMKEVESKLKAAVEKKPAKDSGKDKEEDVGKQMAADLIGKLTAGKSDDAKKSEPKVPTFSILRKRSAIWLKIRIA